MLVAGGDVGAPTQEGHHPVRYPIRPVSRLPVGDGDLLHVLLCITSKSRSATIG